LTNSNFHSLANFTPLLPGPPCPLGLLQVARRFPHAAELSPATPVEPENAAIFAKQASVFAGTKPVFAGFVCCLTGTLPRSSGAGRARSAIHTGQFSSIPMLIIAGLQCAQQRRALDCW
jgi:hypothetical protein